MLLVIFCFLIVVWTMQGTNKVVKKNYFEYVLGVITETYVSDKRKLEKLEMKMYTWETGSLMTKFKSASTQGLSNGVHSEEDCEYRDVKSEQHSRFLHVSFSHDIT